MAHGAHSAQGFELFEEVVHRHFAFGDFLMKGVGVFLADFLLGFFDERDDVAHAKDSACEAFGIELFDGVEFFANADESDGRAGDVLDGEGGAATSVGVEFGEDYAIDVEFGVEALCGGDGVLAGHGVDDEEDVCWSDGGFDFGELVHERVVDVKAACGVEDEGVDAGFASGFDGAGADIDGDANGFAIGCDFVGLGVEGDD